MATLSEVHVALSTALDTVSGLRVSDHIPDQIMPPMAIVSWSGSDYHEAMANGVSVQRYDVAVILGRQDARTSQAAMHEYAEVTGAKSIRACIESDRTLGLANTNVVVDNAEQFGFEDANGHTWLSLRFSVRVHTR